jgi:hypothetical protein
MIKQHSPFTRLQSELPTYEDIQQCIQKEIEELNSNKHYHCILSNFNLETKQVSMELFLDPRSLSQELLVSQFQAYGIDRAKYITIRIELNVTDMYIKVIDSSSIKVTVFQSGNVVTSEYKSDMIPSFLLISNIIEKDIILLFKNNYLLNFYSTNNRNNLVIIMKTIKSTITNSYDRCIISGRKIEARFRCYMLNKSSLFEEAVNSGFADQLVKHYIENEPDTLEYILRCVVGPKTTDEIYLLSKFPLITGIRYRVNYNFYKDYNLVRHAWSMIPSVKDLAKYLKLGTLKKTLIDGNINVGIKWNCYIIFKLILIELQSIAVDCINK